MLTIHIGHAISVGLFSIINRCMAGVVMDIDGFCYSKLRKLKVSLSRLAQDPSCQISEPIT
jgi:hypothetical protein